MALTERKAEPKVKRVLYFLLLFEGSELTL